jgi:hypothetical protein
VASNDKDTENRDKKSYEMKFNRELSCQEISILDSETMYPLVWSDQQSNKRYVIKKTRNGGVKMEGFP